MFGPAPARRKKTGITRSRGGCVSCRARRKKCDEKKPACSSCVRLGRECQLQPSRLIFRTVTFGSEAEEEAPLEEVVNARPGGQQSTSLPSVEADDGFWSPTLSSEIPVEETLFDISVPPIDAVEQQSLAVFTGAAPISPSSQQGHQHAIPSPGIDNLLSMQVSRRADQFAFYSSVWETYCTPSLHPALRRLTHFSSMPSPILDAVLALSACRLSRMTPQKKAFDPAGTPGLSFRPDPDHRTASCERYGSALLSLAQWVDNADAGGIDVALTGMVLLAHLEALNGDFGQFESHSTAIERLTASMTVTVADPSTCELIANWTQARAHNWWRRFHFSTQSIQGSNESMACSPWLSSVLEAVDDPRAVIMTLLCECCRLRSAALLARWDESRITDVGNMAFDLPDPLLLTSPAVESQRAALDRWHLRLPLSELPIERFMEPPGCMTAFEVRPLHFNTHQAAMNYAYYVVSRLFLCGFSTDAETSQASVTQKSNAWGLLLARIAAGIDWDDCLRLNAFIIGFSTLFIPCALHCADVRVGLWLQDWLEERYTAAALEEGSFPVLQGLLALRSINRERRDGRDVCAVFVQDDDGGAATKYDSYDRQHIRSLWVYGRDNGTGERFSRPMALWSERR